MTKPSTSRSKKDDEKSHFIKAAPSDATQPPTVVDQPRRTSWRRDCDGSRSPKSVHSFDGGSTKIRICSPRIGRSSWRRDIDGCRDEIIYVYKSKGTPVEPAPVWIKRRSSSGSWRRDCEGCHAIPSQPNRDLERRSPPPPRATDLRATI